MTTHFLKKLNHLTILIVEDDEIALFGLSQALVPYCKMIFEATDGLSAFEIYRKNSNKIDIILTDINLPELNAFDMLKKIIKINPNQKIMIMTSYLTDKNLQTCFKMNNVLAFLQKPINISDLQLNLAFLTKKNDDDLMIHLSAEIYVNKTQNKIFKKNQEVILNGLSYKIFWLLVNNINQIIEYEVLQDYLYENGDSSIYNLRMAVARLKNQLKNKNIIINVPNEGYMIKSIEHFN